MKDKKYIELPKCGSVLFEKSKRAKRINITIKTSTYIRVAVPMHTSFKNAIIFASAKVDWIISTLNRIKKYERKIDKKNNINIDQAKRYILSRLCELAEKHGFKYNKATIRNQKTRWGSCNSKNDISLNIQLIRVPLELMDYVILHELVHTQIKNHSPEFWRKLSMYVPDPKGKNKYLNKFVLS